MKGETFRITEKGKGFSVDSNLDVKLMKWLLTAMKDVLRRNQKSGFVGSGELELILNIKQNKEGPFISLLFFSHLREYLHSHGSR